VRAQCSQLLTRRGHSREQPPWPGLSNPATREYYRRAQECRLKADKAKTRMTRRARGLACSLGRSPHAQWARELRSALVVWWRQGKALSFRHPRKLFTGESWSWSGRCNKHSYAPIRTVTNQKFAPISALLFSSLFTSTFDRKLTNSPYVSPIA